MGCEISEKQVNNTTTTTHTLSRIEGWGGGGYRTGILTTCIHDPYHPMSARVIALCCVAYKAQATHRDTSSSLLSLGFRSITFEGMHQFDSKYRKVKHCCKNDT